MASLLLDPLGEDRSSSDQVGENLPAPEDKQSGRTSPLGRAPIHLEDQATVYLKKREGESEFVSTKALFDSGNQAGPLISIRKLKELGYDISRDVDRGIYFSILGATSEEPMRTLGSITLYLSREPEGGKAKTLAFQVWDPPSHIDEDILFGRTEDSGPRLPGREVTVVRIRRRDPPSHIDEDILLGEMEDSGPRLGRENARVRRSIGKYRKEKGRSKALLRYLGL
jgi:hypothetical protein